MGTLDGKVTIVTGANTGIGRETAKGLVKEGATVVLACRDVRKAEAARAELAAATGAGDYLVVMPLDLANLASVRAFARDVSQKYGRLDVLVNNAGVTAWTRRETSDGFEVTFGTNHVGTFLLTNELLPALEKSGAGRVVTVASQLYRGARMQWDDLQFTKGKFDWNTVYCQSKLANMLFNKALAKRLEGRPVTANALHPGVVATELIRDMPAPMRVFAKIFFTTPEKGARTSIFVASSPELAKTSGRYFVKLREEPVLPNADNASDAERLWKVTEELVASRSQRAAG